MNISGQKQLGKGKERLVFAHPHDRGKVLKVTYKTDGKSPSYRHELREKQAYQQVQKRVDRDPNPPFSKYYGSVDTDMGRAEVFEAFYGPKGVHLAPTLRYFFRSDKFDEAKLGHLNDFIRKIDQWDIPVSDMHAGNLVYGDRAGQRQFFLIDGLGDSSWVPTARWSRRLRRARLAKNCRLLTQDRPLQWDDQQRQFSL